MNFGPNKCLDVNSLDLEEQWFAYKKVPCGFLNVLFM